MSKAGRSPKVGKSDVGSTKSESQGIPEDKSEIKNTFEIQDKSEIVNRKSEIPMEVHHHPEVEKKGFKEYLLEGLMIFIAVMMGFFAESLREHIADRNRETEYMVSMIADLKSDTVSLANNVRFRQRRVQIIDSLVLLLGSPDLKNDGNSIYFFARAISPPQNIFSNDRTIQQLKKSGSLRLISKWNVSNSIMAYDQKMRVQVLEMNEEQTLREDYRQFARKIFDARIFNSMILDDKIVKPAGNPQLFSTDRELLNEFIASAQYLKKSDETQRRRAGELLKQATQLIALINKEYDL